VQTPVSNGCQALPAVEASEDELLLPAMEAGENEPSFLSADYDDECEGVALRPSVVIVEQMEAEKLLLLQLPTKPKNAASERSIVCLT
jgi:hypothetical protein